MKKANKIICFLLALITVIGLLPVTVFAAPNKVQNDTPELTYHEIDYKPEVPENVSAEKATKDPTYALPSSYKSPYATPIKDQGSYGTCWAFSATSSAEASFNKNGGGLKDFSELQLAYYFYQDKIDPLGNATGDSTKPIGSDGTLEVGGNSLFTMFALANWTNACYESSLPYTSAYTTPANNNNLGKSYAGNYVAHLQNARVIPYSTSSTSLNNVKQAIMDYGTLSCSYYHSNSYYNSSNGAYYTTKRQSNHAVSIVGWNDSYPAQNFRTKPKANGAWLAKNSWGDYDWGTDGDLDPNSSGTEGYFWISYYDVSLNYNGTVFAFDFESADKYQYNYQYDGSCDYEEEDVDAGDKVAAIYTVKGLTSNYEKIDAVGIGIASVNASGNIYIYTGVTNGDPLGGTLAAKQSYTSTYEGFYTFEIDGPVVAKGQNYSVVVEFNKSASVFVDDSYSYSWIKFTANTKNDKTYRITSTGTVSDYKNSGYTARLKAYTNDATNPSNPPVNPEIYTITYDGNGNGDTVTNVPSAVQKTEGVALTLSSTKPSRTGYNFLGWSKDKTATTATYSAGAKYTEEGNATLYAVWQKKPETYTITYNGNGNGDTVTNVPSAVQKTEGVALTLSSIKPSRTGYNFLGWSKDKTATTATYSAGAKYTEEGNATLYAVWQKKPETYTITYNGNGNGDTVTNVPSAVQKTEGVALTLSSTKPSRTGYNFLGWSKDKTATTATYSAGAKYTEEGNATLYAVWQKKPEIYTITFNANGGLATSVPDSMQKTENVTLKLSTVKPTRDGYTFLGWSKDKTAEWPTYIAGGDFKENASVTLYAVWQKNEVEEPTSHNITVKVSKATQKKGKSNTYTVTAYDNGRALSKTECVIKCSVKSSNGPFDIAETFTDKKATKFWIKVTAYSTDYFFSYNNGAIASYSYKSVR